MYQLYDVFAAGNGIFDLAHVLTCRAFADEQSFHLDREHDGDDAQQDADAQRPDAIPDRVIGDLGDDQRAEREHQTDEGPQVLEEYDRQLGLASVADIAGARRGPLVRPRLLDGRAKRPDLEQYRHTEDDQRHRD